MAGLSVTSLLLLVAVLVVTLVASVLGIVCALRSAAAARSEHWPLTVRWGAAAVPCVLVPLCFWLCLYAEYRAARGMARCRLLLSSRVYPAVLEYRLRHPHGALPPKWLGEGREPMCVGSGEPLPYVYVPVPDLKQAAAAHPPGLLAYCPRNHAWPWWAPRILPRRDRLVLDAQGAAHAMSEAELNRRLHPPPPARK